MRSLQLFLFSFFIANFLYGQKITAMKEIEISDHFKHWTTDFSACISENRLTLRNSVLYKDEEGRTHYANIERLVSGICAKKQFFLKNSVCAKAELFVYRGAGLKLICNGIQLGEPKQLPSTGWYFWNIPTNLLKKGLNDFIFTGEGILVIEPSLYPDRSARSFDDGKTWDFDNLGVNNGNGEYLVRLRLQQYPEAGIATSGIYDLMNFIEGENIHGKFVSAHETRISCEGQFISGTEIVIQYRCGDSKFYEPRKWTSWVNLKKVKNTWVTEKEIQRRFIQLRVVLKTKRSDVAPSIEELRIKTRVEYYPPECKATIIEYTPVEMLQTSIPFVYQEPNFRTKALRSMYNLDSVIKEGKTEFEKLVRLRDWARHTAPKGWDWGTSMWCPPWDALVILATNKQPAALCMCTHYSTIFVQCANSLGYVARHLILDHHCVAEVWSDQFKKWILMDTGNSHNPEMNCHLEHNGIPLNALEIRNLWKAGRSNEIKFVYSNESGASKEEIEKFEATYFKNFQRFAIPLRNNFLGNPEPGEPEQGMSEYYCDLYLWWEEKPEPTESPEYSRISNRLNDFYWTINQTLIDLVSLNENSLTVSLYNNVPSFSHYLVSINGGKWQKFPSQFTWNLAEGRNELAVKSVNIYGIECPVSKVVLER
ncbi:MAG: transglutaminase-like domain-containing protein [bacterium]|nr:transglutaminase-like domain-containing protein [bacterium]